MVVLCVLCVFFFSSRRRHTRLVSDWSSDVCSSDLGDIEDAIESVLGRPTVLHGAGRTDAGVHAAAMVGDRKSVV